MAKYRDNRDLDTAVTSWRDESYKTVLILHSFMEGRLVGEVHLLSTRARADKKIFRDFYAVAPFGVDKSPKRNQVHCICAATWLWHRYSLSFFMGESRHAEFVFVK